MKLLNRFRNKIVFTFGRLLLPVEQFGGFAIFTATALLDTSRTFLYRWTDRFPLNDLVDTFRADASVVGTTVRWSPCVTWFLYLVSNHTAILNALAAAITSRFLVNEALDWVKSCIRKIFICDNLLWGNFRCTLRPFPQPSSDYY